MKKGNVSTNLIILFVIFSLILFFSFFFLNQAKEVGKEEQEIKTCIESLTSVALLNKIFNNVFDGTEIINCPVRRVLIDQSSEEEVYGKFSDELLICSQTYLSRIEHFSRLEASPISEESSNICLLCSFISFEDKTQRYSDLSNYLDERIVGGRPYSSFIPEDFEFRDNGIIDSSKDYIFLIHYTDDTGFFEGLGLLVFDDFGRTVFRISGENSYSLIVAENTQELYQKLGCKEAVG